MVLTLDFTTLVGREMVFLTVVGTGVVVVVVAVVVGKG